MNTTEELIKKYGCNPLTDKAGQLAFERKYCTLWDIPADINEAIPALPNRLYCNKDLIEPLEETLRELIALKLHKDIVSFGGCFNPRPIRGTKNTPSMHCWAIAIDLNAHENPLGGPVKFSKAFLDVWRKRFVCGAYFRRLDGMHFELTKGL